jgi:hypothetical protein
MDLEMLIRYIANPNKRNFISLVLTALLVRRCAVPYSLTFTVNPECIKLVFLSISIPNFIFFGGGGYTLSDTSCFVYFMKGKTMQKACYYYLVLY